MICLHCEHDTSYGEEQCTGCGLVFRIEPPFVQANHVSQMTVAIDDFQANQISRSEFLRRLDVFEAIFAQIDSAWDLSTPLTARMSTFDGGIPPAAATTALQILDESVTGLKAALENLQALRNPSNRPATSAERDLLAKAADQLLDFFRGTCCGCATLLNVLSTGQEALATGRELGSLIDIRSD